MDKDQQTYKKEKKRALVFPLPLNTFITKYRTYLFLCTLVRRTGTKKKLLSLMSVYKL